MVTNKGRVIGGGGSLGGVFQKLEPVVEVKKPYVVGLGGGVANWMHSVKMFVVDLDKLSNDTLP